MKKIVSIFIMTIICSAVYGADSWAKGESVLSVYGKEIPVSVYHRESGEYPSYTMTKYIDLINGGIRYKDSHPDEEVYINFALYQLYEDVFFYYNPDDPEYGNITNEKIPERTENIFESVVRCAEKKVNISFTFQSKGTLNSILAENCAGDYLKVFPITWGLNGNQQMHCKYLTMNKLEDADGNIFSDIVYVSSQNIDKVIGKNVFKTSSDRANSGILVKEHTALKAAYDRYFNVITSNCNDQKAFQQVVKKMHKEKKLNYEDECFGTFFTPVIGEPGGDGWDIENNGVARYVTEMGNSKGKSLFYADVYIYYSDAFGLRLYDELMEIRENKKLDVKWAMEENTHDKNVYGSAMKFQEAMEKLGPLAYEKIDHASKIHCKDYIFSYKQGKGYRYITICGSVNLVSSEMNEKANASLIIKETEKNHEVFDLFKFFVDLKFVNGNK